MESLQNLPADGNDDALHDYLQRGIAEIHNNPEAQLPMNIYMNLYSATWRLTYHHKSDGSNTRNTNLYTFPSGIIYRNLSNFLADHLHLAAQRITSQDSSVLLQAYLTEWERYVAAAKRVDHLLNLINRHWIRRYVDEGNREVYFIHTLHCVQWRDHLWNRICDDVVNSAQQVMHKGDGDASKAHDLLENFASLHIDEAIAATDEEMKIRKSLEAPFVSEIEAHHKIIDEAIDERNSIPIGIPVEGSVQ